MSTVAHVKFIGKNITKNGPMSTKEDVELKASKHRSVTYTISTDDSTGRKEVGQQDSNQNKAKDAKSQAP